MDIRYAAFLVGLGLFTLGCGDSGTGGAGGQSPGGNGNGGDGGGAPLAGSTGDGGSVNGGASAGGGGADEGGAGGGGGAPPDGDVVWSNIAVTDGCFLFSDPGILGTQITWSGGDESLTLTFDAVERSYAGALAGDALVLQGDHEEEFDGEVWKYQEIFNGVVVDGVFQGTWTYTECNFTVEPENCPANGGCAGSADFVIAMAADDVDR